MQDFECPPVLLMTFNRPDETQRVINQLALVAPPRLYVVSDGPRRGNLHDQAAVADVREIIGNLPWECESHTLLRETNLGLRHGVIEGIDWFFQREEMGIILEDDCIPDESFFPFCSELLTKFLGDSRVAQIAGNSFFPPELKPKTSYFFSRFPHIWGWASWSSEWQRIHRFIGSVNDVTECQIQAVAKSTGRGAQHIRQLINGIVAGESVTWAQIWHLSLLFDSGYTIFPSENLIKNIGFGENATNTTRLPILPQLHPPLSSIDFPLKHPTGVLVDTRIEHFYAYIFHGFWGKKKRSAARLFTRFFGYRPSVLTFLFRWGPRW